MNHYPNSEVEWSDIPDLTWEAREVQRILRERFPNAHTQTSDAAVYSLVSQLVSLTQGFELIQRKCAEHEQQLDTVVVTRTDLLMKRKIGLSRYNTESTHISNQHEHFPDNLIVYPRTLIQALDFRPHLLTLAQQVEHPVAENFKLSLLKSLDPEVLIESHDWKIEIYRGR